MGQSSTSTLPRNLDPERKPTWEIALLFPDQGHWTEEEYLDLETNRLIELTNGCLEVLPMPTTPHQWIVFFLWKTLDAYVTAANLGLVLGAPLRVRLWPGEFREPDVVFMLNKHFSRIRKKYWNGADLVMEVVSEGAEDRRRDLNLKRKGYAKAQISEYWIVDPKQEKITVLRLKKGKYQIHGEFGKNTAATSHLLPGFSVQVKDVFNHPVFPE